MVIIAQSGHTAFNQGDEIFTFESCPILQKNVAQFDDSLGHYSILKLVAQFQPKVKCLKNLKIFTIWQTKIAQMVKIAPIWLHCTHC